MWVCIVSYIFWGIAFVFRRKLPIPKQVFFLFLAGNTIACILFGMEQMQNKSIGEIIRNSYGEGDALEEFTAVVEGEEEAIAVEIEVSERRYTSEEVQAMFARVIEQLDTVILGENESFDYIEKDLKLVTEVAEEPVRIQWVMSDYQALELDGSIKEDFQNSEGVLVELQAYLSCQEEEAVYVRSAMVYPYREEDLSMKEKVERLIQEVEQKSTTEELFLLPQTIDGKQITWKKATKSNGYVVWATGLLVAILLVFRRKEQEKERKKKRVDELTQDFPKLIGTFTLLLETGMTVKNVWKRMVQNYEEQKRQTGPRVAYEEMRETYYAMQSGVSETQAYEQFGNRCGLSPYRKFGALLSRNLRKGSKGLAGLLIMESIQATEEQKSRMKQKAEEAGTKLLIPMFAMLGVVLMMVVIPAFTTMQI